MSDRSIGDHADHPLAIVVELAATSLIRQHPAAICLEVDIDTNIPLPVESSALGQLLDSLIRQSLHEMNDGGELTITGCETPTGVEIEIADTGCDIEQRACKLPMIAATVSAELTWQNCPQGGGAVTVKLPRYVQNLRKVA